MTPAADLPPRKSRLSALLEHFAAVEDPRDVRRILHPLPEILLLGVCGAIADCDDDEDIAAWGEAHIGFLRRHPPCAHGVPGERWLTILMNRINPGLFSAAFSDWVRESWPDKAGLVAIDGKTSRRSHDRSAGAPPLRLVSACATTARLAPAQAAVPDKAGALAAIPLLLERLGAEDGLRGALVSIDAIVPNAAVAQAIAAQGADYLLAVKANQPTLRAEVEAAFAEAADRLETRLDLDKGHGRIGQRRMTVLRETDWRKGDRRFPAPPACCAPRPASKAAASPGPRPATSSPPAPSAQQTRQRRCASAGPSKTACTDCSTPDHGPGQAVAFGDDLSRLRKGHGARNMATVRHFALNLVRAARDKSSIKSRRKRAGWSTCHLQSILASPAG